MKVKLEKLSNNANRLRTKTVIGECETLPELNKSFEMTSESLTPGMDFRFIQTSPVVKIVNQTHTFVEFETENSTYIVDILNENNN